MRCLHGIRAKVVFEKMFSDCKGERTSTTVPTAAGNCVYTVPSRVHILPFIGVHTLQEA